MALAAIGYAKAMRRRQFMAATSSIGPGAMNMVTAAAVAHANRLPVLLLAGDTFHSRIPDPVLQQVEHFDGPSVTVNDAFRAGHPLLGSHHEPRAGRAVAAARDRDHARPGRVRPGLPRAAAGRPGRGLRLPGAAVRAGRARGAPSTARPPRARRGRRGAARRQGSADRGGRRRPLRARRAGADRFRGGPRRADRRDDGGQVERRRRPPAVRGARSASPARRRPMRSRRRRMSCSPWARACRTSRPGRGPSSPNEDLRIIGLNASRFDAAKHRSLPLVCDAREALQELARRSAAGRRRMPGARSGAGESAAYREHVRARRRPARMRPSRRTRRSSPPSTRLRRARRLRRLVCGRLPGRAQRQLALARRGDVRLRVRLLVHGLRARGRLGRAAWRGRAARFSRSSATART